METVSKGYLVYDALSVLEDLPVLLTGYRFPVGQRARLGQDPVPGQRRRRGRQRRPDLREGTQWPARLLTCGWPILEHGRGVFVFNDPGIDRTY